MSLNDDLWNLYLIDQQVRGLEARLDNARGRVRVQSDRLDQLSQQLATLQHQLRQVEATAANLENDVLAAEQRITALREKMNSVQSNKQYSAFLVEVNTLKTDKSKLEEQALELMNQADTLRAELAGLQEQIAQQQKLKDHSQQELAGREAEVADRLEALRQQRDQAAGKIPPEPRAVFQRLADTMEGEAMATVIEEDRRRMEYSCGGCYMQLPVERINQLVTQDKLVRCSSCQRILHIDPQLRETMGVKQE